MPVGLVHSTCQHSRHMALWSRVRALSSWAAGLLTGIQVIPGRNHTSSESVSESALTHSPIRGSPLSEPVWALPLQTQGLSRPRQVWSRPKIQDNRKAAKELGTLRLGPFSCSVHSPSHLRPLPPLQVKASFGLKPGGPGYDHCQCTFRAVTPWQRISPTPATLLPAASTVDARPVTAVLCRRSDSLQRSDAVDLPIDSPVNSRCRCVSRSRQ